MSGNPEILILDDDPIILKRLIAEAERHKFTPIPARSPDKAIRLLEAGKDYTPPVLAIIDWDMSFAQDRLCESKDVLVHLWRKNKDCRVVVFSANLMVGNTMMQVNAAHPQATFHPKNEDGERGLFERVRQMLETSLGDIALRGGVIICSACDPPGVFYHKVGITLLLKAPNAVRIPFTERDRRQVTRFEHFLRKCGSRVIVKRHREMTYSLYVMDKEEAAEVNAQWLLDHPQSEKTYTRVNPKTGKVIGPYQKHLRVPEPLRDQ